MSGFDDLFLSDVLQPVAHEPPKAAAPDVSSAPQPQPQPALHLPGSAKNAPGNLSPSGIRRPESGLSVPRMALPKGQAPAKSRTSTDEVAKAIETPPVQEDPLPFDGLVSTFATADPMNAGEYLCVIPADVNEKGGLNLGAEMRGSLRAEVRQWVDSLRKRNSTAAGQLRSLSPRDDAIDFFSTRILDQACKSRTGVWTAALPTGRQLALVRQDVLSAIGLDQLVRCIHHQAIKVAMANGDAYSQEALQAYEVGHPAMSAAGVN